MLSQTEALEHFNHDKDYEDKLAYDINFYLIDSLKNISGISEKDKAEITRLLKVIIYDTLKHSAEFTKLIEYVVENGNTQY